MDSLFKSIVDDDRIRVRALLSRNPGLATRQIREASLYDASILHWIYAGDTALHVAAAGHRAGCARLLIESGANPNAAENRRRSTPLHYAADGFVDGPAWDAGKQVETLRCLVEAGAELHVQDANGATPLHRAVRTRCAAAVRFLLDSGGDPAAVNHSGSTPFHLAVQNTGRGGSGSASALRAQQEIIGEFLARKVSRELRGAAGRSVRESARSEWIRRMLA